MDATLNSRTHLHKSFFDFSSRFVRVSSFRKDQFDNKNCAKLQIGTKKLQNLTLIWNPLNRLLKTFLGKQLQYRETRASSHAVLKDEKDGNSFTFLEITFLWELLSTFKISVFCHVSTIFSDHETVNKRLKNYFNIVKLLNSVFTVHCKSGPHKNEIRKSSRKRYNHIMGI